MTTTEDTSPMEDTIKASMAEVLKIMHDPSASEMSFKDMSEVVNEIVQTLSDVGASEGLRRKTMEELTSILILIAIGPTLSAKVMGDDGLLNGVIDGLITALVRNTTTMAMVATASNLPKTEKIVDHAPTFESVANKLGIAISKGVSQRFRDNNERIMERMRVDAEFVRALEERTAAFRSDMPDVVGHA